MRGKSLDSDLELMIQQAWKTGDGTLFGAFLRPMFQTPATLIGIGAPIHHFLPDVANALSADWEISKYAGVANAFGAAISRIETTYRVKVRVNDAGKYQVYGPYEEYVTAIKEQALENAREQSRRAACEEAKNRGIVGELQAETKCTDDVCETSYGENLYLGSWAVTTVRGSVMRAD